MRIEKGSTSLTFHAAGTAEAMELAGAADFLQDRGVKVHYSPTSLTMILPADRTLKRMLKTLVDSIIDDTISACFHQDEHGIHSTSCLPDEVRERILRAAKKRAKEAIA